MNHHALVELMYAVLDGEATEAQTRELERRLAADGRARAEFDELAHLFQALRAVPHEHPPEGLVAAVTAALPSFDAESPMVGQPFASARVFGHAPSYSGGDPSGDPATEAPTPASDAPTRSFFMSQQRSRTFGNRKVWAGIGIAAAVVVVAQYGFDFPLGQDVTGTIVPAQRYRAAPNGSEQVKLGAPAAAAQTPAAPAIAPVVPAPDRSAVERSTLERTAADKAVDRTAADMAAKRNAADALAADMAAKRNSADGVAADMAAKRAVVDRAAVDRAALDRTAVDRAAVDRAALDRSAVDRAAVDRTAVERAALERTAAERSALQRSAVERTAAERAALDRAAADRVGPNRQQ